MELGVLGGHGELDVLGDREGEADKELRGQGVLGEDAVALEADRSDTGADERTDATRGGQVVSQVEGGAGGLGVDVRNFKDVLAADVQAEVELMVEV